MTMTTTMRAELLLELVLGLEKGQPRNRKDRSPALRRP